MPIQIHAESDIPEGLDALTDALAQCRVPGEVVAIEDGLHRSLMWRCNVLKNDERRIGPGPVPRFFVAAKRLCAARHAELTAELRQARGGASSAFGKEG